MDYNYKSSSQKPVIILGSGRHAKLIINILKNTKYKILGLTDPHRSIKENFEDIKILGNDEVIFNYDTNEVELVNGIGELTLRNVYYNLNQKFRNKGYTFAKIIHPSAIIENKVEIGDGSQIMSGAIIQQGVKIGSSCIINTGTTIDHECIINDYCHLAPGVTLSGDVVVGERTHIGTGTSVIDKIKIGKNCIIGAGSIIYKDIRPNTKYIQLRKEHLEEIK